MAQQQAAGRRIRSAARKIAAAGVAAVALLTGAGGNPAYAHTAPPGGRDSGAELLTDPKHLPPVHLDWEGMERDGTALPLRDDRLTIVARNDLAEPVRVQLGARLTEGPEMMVQDLGTLPVPAGGTASAQLDVRSFGIDYRRLAAPASLVAAGEVSSGAGEVIARALADTLFVATGAGSGDVVAYDATAMRERLATRDQTSSSGHALLAIADGRAGLPDPGLPENGQTYRFCMKYRVDTVDSGFGEDFHAHGDVWILAPNKLVFGLWPAHGAAYQLREPGGEWGEVKYADIDTGCFSFSSTHTSGFTIRMLGEAKLHGDNMLKVERRIGLNEYEGVSWEINADPGTAGTHIYWVPGGDEASLIGIGSSVVHRVAPLIGQPFTGKTLHLTLTPEGANTCGGDGGACQGGDRMWAEKAETHEKFTIGHEVGHWMHYRWSGTKVVPGSVSHNDAVPACAYVGVGSHAMRSREQAGAAFNEGIGHFVSALAWNEVTNTDAWFKYYKVTSDPNMELYNNDLIDVTADVDDPKGGIVNWNDNKCEAETSPKVGYSVEQDWLRFLWDYATAPGTTPTLHEVVDQIGAVAVAEGLTEFNVARKFEESLQGSPYHDRWVDLAEIHGVDNSL